MSSGRAPRPPGIGSISLLAAVVVLVPGILVYLLMRAVGLGIGPAGLLGLLVMIGGMVAYPLILRRTGWVGPPRPRAASPGTRQRGARQDEGEAP